MKKFTLSLFMMIFTICSYAQLAQETFETWPPAQWYIFNDVTDAPQSTITWGQGTGTPGSAISGYNSPSAAYLNRENLPPPNTGAVDWLVTKSFPVPLNPILRFYTKLVQGGDQGNKFDIRISENASQMALGNYVSLINTAQPYPWGETDLMDGGDQTQYIQKIVTIPDSYIGKTCYIAFVMKGMASNGDRWLVDNVSVDTRCAKPTIATPVFTNPTTGGATLQWVNPSGATSQEIEVVQVGVNPTGTGVVVTATTSIVWPPVGQPNLTPDTDYRYYIRSLCSPTNPSEWAGPFNFSTVPLGARCGEPLPINTLPFQTNNTTANFGDFVEGTPGASCNGGSTALNGNEVIYKYTATFTGLININMTNNGANSGMFVYTSCANIGTACVAGGIGNAVTPVLLNNFSVTTGQDYYIVISTAGSTQTTAYTLIVQAASCAPPTSTAPTTGIGPNSAPLSWTSNAAGITSWEIVVQPAGTGIPQGAGTQTNINTNYPAGGLLEATPYEYWIRNDCNNGTFSAWAGPYFFSTTQVPAIINYTQDFESAVSGFSFVNGTQPNKWVIGTATSNGGTQSLYISNDNGVTNTYTGTTASTVHVYRDVQIPTPVNEISVSFDWKGVGETSDYFDVWLVPNTFVPVAGTPITAVANQRIKLGGNYFNNAAWTNAEYTQNVSLFAGQIMRIVIEWRNNTTTANIPPAAIDNFNIKLITCSKPSGLTATNPTLNAVNLTWVAPPSGADSYEYYYSTSSVPPTDTTTPSGATAGLTANPTDLTDNSVYYVWVRSVCGGTNGKSLWFGPVSFMTPQIPATLNYNEDFEGALSNFSFINGTLVNKWYVGTATSNGGTKSLYISNTDGTTNAYNVNVTTGAVFAYRDFIVPATMPHNEIDVTFDWKAGGETTVDLLKVWIVPITYNPVAGTPITAAAGRQQVGGNFNLNANWNTVTYTLDQTLYLGQTRRLIFEWRNDIDTGLQPPAAVDNINIKIVTCKKPTNLAAPLATITQTTAQLSWTEVNSATNWFIYVVPLGQPAPGSTTVGEQVTGGLPTYLAENLLPGTQYTFWVRSDCGGTNGMSAWAGPFQFATKIANDECDQAVTLTVNADSLCGVTTLGTINGATASPQPNACTGTADDDDAWFQFTATETEHYLAILDTQGANGIRLATQDLIFAVYSGDCTTGLTQVVCSAPNNAILPGLIPGQIYKVRVYSAGTTAQNWSFRICVGTVFNCQENSTAFCAGPTSPPFQFLGSVGVPSLGARNCLTTTPNPTFFTVRALTAGTLQFTVSQTLIGGGGIDVDFIAYGPFSSPTAGCAAGLIPANMKDCSYSTAAVEQIDIAGVQPGQYYTIMVTNFNGGRSTVNFTQNTSPGFAQSDCNALCTVDLGPDETLCGTPSKVLNAFVINANPNGYKWYLGPDLIPGATTATYTATQTGVYKVIVDKPECVSVIQDEINLIFGPAINLPAQITASVCGTGGTATVLLPTFNNTVLGSLDPTQYVVEYYLTAAAAALGTAPLDPAVAVTLTGVPLFVRVEALNAPLCFDVAELGVTIATAPDADIAYTGSPYCSTETTGTVTQTGNAGGVYSSATGLAIDPATGAINIAGSTPGTYTVTYTIAATATCAEFVDTAQVVIVEAPNATIGYTTPLCSNGTTAAVTQTGTTGGAYSSTAGLTIDPATGEINIAGSTPGTYDVTYTIAATADCPAFTTQVQVVINQIATAAISYGTTPFCSNGGVIAVTQTGTTGGAYTAPAGLSINAATGEINLGASTAGTYTVTYTIAATGGCDPVTATASVTITTLPVATFSYTTATVCQNVPTMTVNLGTGAAAGTFTADIAGLSINPATGQITPGTSTPATYVVTNTIPAANGCPAVTAQFTVTINAAPVATFSYGAAPFCKDDANPSPQLDGVAGTFSSTAGLVISASGQVNLAQSTPGTYTVTNTIAGSAQCPSYFETATITVIAIPVVTVAQGCEGNSYIVEVNFDGDNVYNEDTVSFTWKDPSGNTLASTNREVTVTATGIYNVTITPNTAGACAITVPVQVDDTTCLVQRGISPNNDGFNDTFDLTALSITKISIYNRYGQEVFSYGAYTDQWHGQGKGGDELPTGTYFYSFERAGGEKATGWVYINREEN